MLLAGCGIEDVCEEVRREWNTSHKIERSAGAKPFERSCTFLLAAVRKAATLVGELDS